MNQVLAAGVILFRCRGSSSKEYLLLQKRNEKWAPAKGMHTNSISVKSLSNSNKHNKQVV